ncbi:hypothetical protein [Pseudooceanicola sp. MF1-13]|uniref:hypothetical protein n=1 Tax=Pseudooceanicola sp. MF1-13 TaxID=3379095 RepID=UPI003891D88A
MVRTAFFVFSQRDVNRLKRNLSLLDEFDTLVTCIPGIDIEELSDYITCLSLEDALETFQITQLEITRLTRKYARNLISADGVNEIIEAHYGNGYSDLRQSLEIISWVLAHNSVAFELVFESLVDRGLCRASCFQFHGSYRKIDRLDVKRLLHVEIEFGKHLEYLCKQAQLPLVKLGSGWRLATYVNALRDLLLLGYKAKTLLSRSFRAPRSVLENTCDLAVLVRARTEVVAAAPLMEARGAQGKYDVMLVDDLIKSPDGTCAAAASGRPWVSLHSFSRPVEIARILARCTFLRRRAARSGTAINPGLATAGFLGRPEIATEVLYTALASVPELLVYRLQLTRAIDQLGPQSVISFDTVDRWGALQGVVARTARVRSVMIQNTAADAIMYPCPLVMDHLVVGNERLREIFTASGADPERVHAFGLPIQDDVLIAGNARLDALINRAAQGHSPLRVLVATQPFVQEFDYNAALIDSLETAASDLDFPLVWLLKPHPREPLGKYETVRDRLASRSQSVTLFSGPFENALSEADVVLSRTSTSLEFAALGGVPGIAHLHRYPRDIVDRLDYLKSSVTDKSYDTSGLRALLQEYAPERRVESLEAYSNRRAEFINEFFPGKGRATDRVSDLIASGSSAC